MIKALNTADQMALEALKTGATLAIQKLYDQHLPGIILWIKENSGSESDARDVFQEAMVALFRKVQREDIELTCPLKNYIRAICKNLWLAKIRKQRKMISLDPEMEEDLLDKSIVKEMESTEQRSFFYRHFQKLGDSCQQILALFFEKTPLQEIADKLSTSLAYIKKRKFQCKEQLVQSIQNDPHFEEFKR
ncbi:MAG: sigma-70 family RNA polymerase sigma factor [Saprospiraceae bacterium]|nr:sigma-70 family RNA polymerase sigma factor [Saprospiraceae bacterium]